jgi:transmembrane sensor
MENEHLIELIAKELSQEISSDESNDLKQLLQNSDNQEVYKGLKDKWVSSGKLTANYQPNTESSWLNFKTTLNSRNTKVFRINPVFYRVAAVLILGIGMGYFYLQNSSHEKIEYYTDKDEVKEITLPDSSKIWLNESSYLAFDDSFNSKQRQVILKGEAFFEVEKDPSKPFIILSHEARTQVLGTSFNILAYETQSYVEIDVKSGKVAFSEESSDDNLVTLVKGESARLDLNSLTFNKSNNQNPNYNSWKTKQLVFEDAKLTDVINDLNDYFNINIQLASSALASCKLTSKFSDPTIDEVLEVLKFTLNITIQNTEKGITLNGSGC